MSNKKKPTILVILDGWGVAPPSKSNVIDLAKKPNLEKLYKIYPSTVLGATGEDVGLKKNRMSGSEAGHINIGAGRIVMQDSLHITQMIEDGSFFKNQVLLGAVENTKKNSSQFHLMGLMGNIDSPHSNPEHFRAVLRTAKEKGISEVFCHLFTDGRDSYPRSALEHLKNFRKIISEEGIGKIATIGGRFYGMDRAKNWSRLIKAYEAMAFGKGEEAQSVEEAIENAYQKNLNDEYILPTVIMENGQVIAKISKGDSIVFFNLRSDRARQFTKLFVLTNQKKILEDKMPQIKKIEDLYFVAMTAFGPDLDVHIIFSEASLIDTLPVALKDVKQLYIAEMEKFAHITYFINGGYADSVDGEDRIMIDSPITDSYAKIPEMAAGKITEKILEFLENNKYDFIAVNYANADMVGHTGDFQATVKAVEFLDKQIGILSEAILKIGGRMIITADHGNADDMVDFGTDQPNTFHTKNPVPFLVVGEDLKDKKLRDGGVLGNIVPTVLDILGKKQPSIMDKKSLLE